MTAALPLGRRIVLVLAMLALGLFFGRDVVAAGLIARSDAVLSAQGDPVVAARYAQRARLFDRTYPDAAKRIARIALQSHDAKRMLEAVSVTALALQRAPSDEQLGIEHAQLLFQLDRYRESALAWASLAALYPSTPLYRGWAAEAARIGGNCDLALTYFRQMLARNPDDRRSRQMIRNVEVRKGRGECSPT